MWNPYISRPKLHVLLENSWFVVTLVLSHAEVRLCRFVWSELISNRWRCIVCLAQLPFVLWLSIPWPFRNWPLRLVLCFARVRTFLWMVCTRPYDFWGGIQQNKRIKAFYSPPRVKTVLRHVRNLRLETGTILRTGRHFIFLFTRRKLNKQKSTKNIWIKLKIKNENMRSF